MASSDNFSALSWDASLVKTKRGNGVRQEFKGEQKRHGKRQQRTKAGREEHHVQISQKLLLIGIEVAKARDNVSRQAHTDYFQNSLEDEQAEVC